MSAGALIGPAVAGTVTAVGIFCAGVGLSTGLAHLYAQDCQGNCDANQCFLASAGCLGNWGSLEGVESLFSAPL